MILATSLFFGSIILAPWWLAVMVAVILLGRFNVTIPVIIGGMLLDLIYGAPIPLLFDHALLYTLIFSILALVSKYLHVTMLE